MAQRVRSINFEGTEFSLFASKIKFTYFFIRLALKITIKFNYWRFNLQNFTWKKKYAKRIADIFSKMAFQSNDFFYYNSNETTSKSIAMHVLISMTDGVYICRVDIHTHSQMTQSQSISNFDRANTPNGLCLSHYISIRKCAAVFLFICIHERFTQTPIQPYTRSQEMELSLYKNMRGNILRNSHSKRFT